MFGPQTAVVDGQRFAFPTSYQYQPASYGQQTTGVPQVSPVMPPFIGGGTPGGGVGAGGGDDVDGYGTSGNNSLVTQIANQHPHSLKVSPVWWAVGALVVGLTLLRAVHWRKTVLEGGESVSARVGAGEE